MCSGTGESISTPIAVVAGAREGERFLDVAEDPRDFWRGHRYRDAGPSFAAAGEVVTYDVFQLESYLVDPVVAVDLSTGRTELRFSAAGPLVELLGLGAEPHSPMQLSLGDTQALNDRLEELEFDSIVVVDDPQGDSTIQYHTQSPRMPAKALLAGVSMEFELVEATGKRDDTDQDLVVDEWTIEFADGKNLIGSSLYHVLGGSFGFSGEAAFDDSSYAQTSVSCN